MNENDIKAVVRECVPEVLRAYGVDVTNPTAAQADMAFLRRRREFQEKFSTRTRLTVITALLTSAVGGMIYFIKEVLKTGI